MSAPPIQPHETVPDVTGQVSGWWIRGAALVILFGVFLAYVNSLNTPFVFDDVKGIVNNPTIRDLGAIGEVLSPPMHATGAGGRPVVNLSLAINYALGGLDVQGYHWFNMLVHGLSALVLFGLIRRTLSRPVLREKFGSGSLRLSFSVAFLWALHPLLTESVTGIIQRTESLGGLFYLLTLYAFARSVNDGQSIRWQGISVLACLVGMATKEIMATVPVITLLYDRTFVAGSFRQAWQERWRFYVALMATWGLLAWLVLSNESRGGMVGFGLGMSAWDYALTQCRAIILYLKLSFWPHPLVVDYGAEVVDGPGAVWWQGVLLLSLVAGTLVALVRKPIVGFVAFTFFSILAPSSSFVPLTTQTIAEHRMYLPLAAVLILVVAIIYARGGKWIIPIVMGLALVGGVATANRNKDYRSVVALWEDTVEKVPTNSRAQANLAASYVDTGKWAEAIEHSKEALRLKPRNADARYNLGNVYLRTNRYAEAMSHYREVLTLDPGYGMAHYGLGYCLVRTNRMTEAVEAFERAHQLRPNDPVVLHSLASTLAFTGRIDEGMEAYRALREMTPHDRSLPIEIASMLARAGRNAEAVEYYEEALRDTPSNSLRYSMALSLLQLGRFAAAENELRQVVRANPKFPEPRNALGEALMGLERWDDAAREFEAALRAKPDYEEARLNLDRAEIRRDLRR